MEEEIDYLNVHNSPREWALHFLLRHNECRTALISGTDECDQPLRVGPELAKRSELQEMAPANKPVGSPAAAGAAKLTTASGESCALRFSRAFAAARHR